MRFHLAVLVLASLPVVAGDSILGTWRLNVERSELSANDPRYETHTCKWSIVERKVLYEEEGTLTDGKAFGPSDFLVNPSGPSVRFRADSTFGRIGEFVAIQLFGDDMLLVKVLGPKGNLLRRWMVVLKDDGKQLVITQTKGGIGKRVYDRVE